MKCWLSLIKVHFPRKVYRYVYVHELCNHILYLCIKIVLTGNFKSYKHQLLLKNFLSVSLKRTFSADVRHRCGLCIQIFDFQSSGYFCYTVFWCGNLKSAFGCCPTVFLVQHLTIEIFVCIDGANVVAPGTLTALFWNFILYSLETASTSGSKHFSCLMSKNPLLSVVGRYFPQ